MIKLRNISAAFIFNGKDVLMLKTSPSKKLFPNLWTPVGGHIEADEFRDPLRACIREIYEETGIWEKELDNIALRYITVRRKDDEIRIQYIYFAETKVKTITNSDEGELFWVNKSSLQALEMSFVNKSVIEHYFSIGSNNDAVKTDAIITGVVDVINNNPIINWLELKNFNNPMYI